IYKFNGSTWIQSAVQGQDTQGALTAIAFRNNSEGWAASTNRKYKYDGSSWKEEPGVINYYDNIVETIATTTDVWFYGGKTYRWDGSQLTDQNLTQNSIKDMHFYNSSLGFAIDDYSTTYMFNGVGWISLGEISSYRNSVSTISGTSKNDVWASDETYLYHYDGTSWKRQNDGNGTGINYSFGQIRMVSPTEGWATTGGAYLSSHYYYYYNGTSWTKIGEVNGNIGEIKDFGNGNLWGIVYTGNSNPNKLMRLK
ncbi:MAG: hypothetical protein Q8N83_00045, partial [Ignavibacteria bacterium]|nr:hypothetical protein [Ignavibacteria bacterium]